MFSFFVLILKSIFIYIKNILTSLYIAIEKICIFLYNFLSPCVDSIKGELNEQEIYRIVSLTLSSGGGLYAVTKTLYINIDILVTNPVLAYQIKTFVEMLQHNNILIAILFVIFIGESIRRKYLHGQTQ